MSALLLTVSVFRNFMPPRKTLVPAMAVIESQRPIKYVRFTLPEGPQTWIWEGAPAKEGGMYVLRDGPELPEQLLLQAQIEFQDGSQAARRVAVHFVH